MNDLDPSASAALSSLDDVMVTMGCNEDAALCLGQQAKVEPQHMIDGDPSLMQLVAPDEPYLNDWF